MNRVNENDSWVRGPDGAPGFTASYITGCWKRCSYCFAMELANGRLKSRYLANDHCAPGFNAGPRREFSLDDPFWPRAWPKVLNDIEKRQKPTGIFLNIMGEWAHEQIPVFWKKDMLDCIKGCPQHVFYLLTKQYDQLPVYAFPDNCLVGASVTDSADLATACYYLAKTRARIKFLSIEPLLGMIIGSTLDQMLLVDAGIKWVIVGAATGTSKMLRQVAKEHPELVSMEYNGRRTAQPPARWVTDIIKMAKAVGARVFLKNNLYPGLSSMDAMDLNDRPYWIGPGDGYELRQEAWK